jgi:hypothetical protein
MNGVSAILKAFKEIEKMVTARSLVSLFSVFTKKGNYHRIKFLWYISIFLVCFFLLFVLSNTKGQMSEILRY